MHDHSHRHDHHHPHTHHGHNGGPSDHLHSHLHGHAVHESAEELKVLTGAFVDGFRRAEDKTSYLRLAGIPFQRPGTDGLTLHLVDASIVANWQIGTASPAFATRELAYLPFPGSMVTSRETMMLTYVSLTERADVDIVQVLAARSDPPQGSAV
jgi:hypothetical protein